MSFKVLGWAEDAPARFAEDDLEDRRRAAWAEVFDEHDHARFVAVHFGGSYGLAGDWKDGGRWPQPTATPTEADGSWGGHWPLRAGGYPPAGQPVVYLLRAASGERLYIGSTDNLRVRLADHQRKGKRWATWSAEPYPTRATAYEVESAYLVAFMPPLNVQRPSRREAYA